MRETPCSLCSPFQTQLALHVIVSWFNHVQLLFVCLSTWQWSRSLDLCRGRAASLPLITPSLPALPQPCCLEVHSPRKVFASEFSASLLTISMSVHILLHYCEKCQYIQTTSHGLIVASLAFSGHSRQGLTKVCQSKIGHTTFLKQCIFSFTLHPATA